MVVEWAKPFIDFLKLKPATLIAAGLTLLVVAMVPQGVSRCVGFEAAVAPWRGLIGLAGICCTIFGTCQAIVPRLLAWASGWMNRRALAGKILELSRQEKQVLALFIREDTSCQYFGFDNGLAGGLVAQGILYWPVQALSVGGRNPCNLQPLVRELIVRNSKVRDDILAVNRVSNR